MTQAIEQVTYEDLYRRWETGNWESSEIDFSEDREQWRTVLTADQRRSALFNYSLFFHGEDVVTDTLGPFIDAAPREEQKYFLATQLADEARHAVFFARWLREVVHDTDDAIGGSLDATQGQLSWGHHKVFGRLEEFAVELREEPTLPNLAAGIALYHFVVESTLGQPGQHWILDYLEEHQVLPGFHRGLQMVSRDEQRHIAFGVKLMSELIRDDECREAAIGMLRQCLPWTLGVLIPPNFDERYFTCWGSNMVDVFAIGNESLWSKLRAAGFTDDEIAHVNRSPVDATPQERIAPKLALARANIVGDRNGPVDNDPELVRMLFESMQYAVDRRAAPPEGFTIQWVFDDTEPWHLRITRERVEPVNGRAPAPDLTLRCKFEDWADVSAGRADSRMLMLRRRIRVRGGLRAVKQMRELFPR